MFDLIQSDACADHHLAGVNGDRILAAILFEQTMDRAIDGEPSASFLWQRKNVVPLLKIDKGLTDVADGVQLMKPIPGLDDLLTAPYSTESSAQGALG